MSSREIYDLRVRRDDVLANRYFDGLRFFSSATTGVGLAVDNPLLSVGSGCVYVASTIAQRVYNRFGDNGKLRGYFSSSLLRDFLSLATGFTLGVGLDKSGGEITAPILVTSSLPAFVAGVSHIDSLRELGELEVSLQ